MISHKYIDEYLDYCQTHPEEINELRKLAIENVYKPVLNDDSVYLDVEMYEKCITFCENNYYALFPYQKFIYAFVFLYRDDIPVFNTFVIVEGRGNGKDGAFMPLMHFLTTPIHGIKNYHCDIIANNESQSKDSFKVVYDCLEDHKGKFNKLYDWTKELIKNVKTKSEIRYNTSNAQTKDGKKSGIIFFNEYHAYVDYKQINVFSSQLGKIKHPRTFIVTTFGYVRDGPLDDLMSVCKHIIKTGENDLGYYPFICTVDDIKDVDNPEMWVKANPSLPFMPVLKAQIMKDYLEMKKFPSKRPEFLTKRMNLPAHEDEVMVANWNDIESACYSDVDNRIERELPFETEEDMIMQPCIIAIDYADIRDFVSVGRLWKTETEYVWRQHSWICCNSPFFEGIKFPFDNYGSPGFNDFEIVNQKSIQIDDIVEYICEQIDRYNVVKVVMDIYRFGLFRKAFEDKGFTIESKQCPDGLIRVIRSQGAIQALVAPLIEQSFVEHKINFGNSAIMRWYTNNTSVRIDKYGNKAYQKIEPKLRKNDGFMAFEAGMSCEKLLDVQIIYV